MLAGALQDNGRAKVVGEKTFGKGLIQTIVELSDGSGVAVTVARYQTPLGTDINKKGIQPDISIDNGEPFSEDEPTNKKDDIQIPSFCAFHDVVPGGDISIISESCHNLGCFKNHAKHRWQLECQTLASLVG